MRVAILAAFAVAVSSAFTAAHAKASTEAVLKVGFPQGNPFGKNRLPALEVLDAGSQKIVASLRAKEWTQKSATYETALPAGKTYSLRWALASADAPFALLPIASEVSGTVVFRIPYVPRVRKPGSAPLASAGLARLAP